MNLTVAQAMRLRGFKARGGKLPVFRFRCGHIGRPNSAGYRAKARGFIKVAELRGAPVTDKSENCPDCKR